MDEVNHTGEVDGVLRELTMERDRMLGDAPALTPARLAILHDLLARQFPIEAALSEAGLRRDELLHQHQLQLSSSVERALQELLVSEPTEVMNRAIWIEEWRSRASGWLRLFRWPTAAAAAAVFLAIAAGIIHFGNWGFLSGNGPEERTQASIENRPKVYSGAIRERSSIEPEGAREEFGLRISTAELASLQASFLATSRAYRGDGADMRLDLPVRAILVEAGIARTP